MSNELREAIEVVKPDEIEKKSFEIIEAELRNVYGKEIDPAHRQVVYRAIHTSADFEYASSLIFSEDAVRKGREALRSGATIVTDTTMALAGINKSALSQLGVSAHCLVADPEVWARAKEEGSTRSSAAVDIAIERYGKDLFFVCGNAPTALVRLYEKVQQNTAAPCFVVGVPVGFVNVVPSKKLIASLEIPHIVAMGRKGGSNVAASIVNALMYEELGLR